MKFGGARLIASVRFHEKHVLDANHEGFALIAVDEDGNVLFLPRIKMGTVPDASPRIGFRTREVAEYYIAERQLSGTCSYESIGELKRSGMLKDGIDILIFESVAEIIEAYRDWGAWRADQHISHV